MYNGTLSDRGLSFAPTYVVKNLNITEVRTSFTNQANDNFKLFFAQSLHVKHVSFAPTYVVKNLNITEVRTSFTNQANDNFKLIFTLSLHRSHLNKGYT